jgi:transposase InsO family protein
VEAEQEKTIGFCIRRPPSAVIHRANMTEEDPVDEIDWMQISEEELEAWRRRLALVETLIDESIDESERRETRWAYQREHEVGERTIRNYLKRYREQGPGGLLHHRRGQQPRSVRIHDEALRKRILSLIEERPRRTVPQLRRLLTRDSDYKQAINAVSDRTVYRFLSEQGLSQKQRAAKASDGGRRSFHQFQASASMELVQGDARDGIWLPDPEDETGKTRKTYLFAWVDDFSRRILSARYFWDERLPRMEQTFKTMILRWGIPEKVYLDNGRVYVAAQFTFVLSQLAIKKIHHRPYQAWCKGKVEAVMKTLKTEFQAEAQRAGFQTLEELNTALWAWIDVEYNRRNHSSTGQPPAQRFTGGLPKDHRRIEDLAWFEALFLLRDHRTVSKYGVVKLESNRYRTQAPAGSVVEIRYDPFDLRTVWRFEDGHCVETLAPQKIVNASLPNIAEERSAKPTQVSASASAYFATLRQRQSQLRAEADTPQYNKLKKGEQRS